MPIHTDSGITDLHAEEFTEEQTVTQLVKKLPVKCVLKRDGKEVNEAKSTAEVHLIPSTDAFGSKGNRQTYFQNSVNRCSSIADCFTSTTVQSEKAHTEIPNVVVRDRLLPSPRTLMSAIMLSVIILQVTGSSLGHGYPDRTF